MRSASSKASNGAAPCVPFYRGSLAFGAGERAGAAVSGALSSFFLFLDRALRAGFAGRVVSWAKQRGPNWGQSSLFVRKVWVPVIWPLFKLALAPWGEALGPETVLGITLALACALPTEVVFLALAGAFCVMLWSRAKRAGSAKCSSCGRQGSAFWILPEFGTTLALAVVFVFLFGATLSSALPRASVYNLAIWCFYGLAFFMAADAAARGKAELVIWPFLTGATFSGLVAMYQKATGWMPPRSWLDARFEEDIVRYVGTFTNPTFFAEMLGLALPLTAALLLRKKDWRDKLVLLAFAGIQGIGMVLSFSRGAWLGLIVSLGILAVLFERRLLAVGLIVGIIALYAAPPVLVDRLLSSFSLEDSSNSYRVFIWRGSIAMLRRYLFRGVGLGAEAYAYVYPEFMIVQTPAPHAHSVYMQMLIEVGLFGFLAIAWFFLVWLRDVLQVVFGEKGGWSERWAEIGVLAGIFAAVAGQMLQGAIEHTWYNPRVTLAFWAIVGIGSGIVLNKRESRHCAGAVTAPPGYRGTGGAGE